MGGNKGRFFAFGCSYTGYNYATWADLIGANFDEYYNFGKGGSCNTYILNKFVEVDNLLNINSEDYVAVLFTGMNRFSYFHNDGWVCNGNVYHPGIDEGFVKNMWSSDWGIYNSWISINTIKTILEQKNVKFKLLSGMENYASLDSILSYRTEYINKLYNDFSTKLTNSTSFDNWRGNKFMDTNDISIKYKNGFEDSHPKQLIHYNFVKEYFSEFDTEYTKQRYELAENIFDFSSFENQAKSFFNHIKAQFDKSINLELL